MELWRTERVGWMLLGWIGERLESNICCVFFFSSRRPHTRSSSVLLGRRFVLGDEMAGSVVLKNN